MAYQQASRTTRVWLPAAVFAAFAVVVLGRLVQVQIIEHDRYAAEARGSLLASDTVFARRGSILDRNGFLLAMSADTWDLYVSTRAWRDEERAVEGSEAIAAATGLDAAELRELVGGSELVDVLIAHDVPYETGRILLDGNAPGLVALPNTERVYPAGDLAASMIGIIGRDNTGLSGIEWWYDDELQGTPGRVIFERDTTGSPIPYGEAHTVDPVRGRDIVLTIDRRLQALAERALAEAVAGHRAEGGAVVMLDPRTGEVLALATQPAIAFSTLDLADPEQVGLLRNHAVTDLYEPGSVMKVITAAAAIDAGLVTPETEYVDEGVVTFYGIPISNWSDAVHGPQTMTGVLQHSINTGAVFMVEKLGAARFHEYLDGFGFGAPTGIDLNGEAASIFRRPTGDPNWSPVDLATQSFGQSISVTPIQMASAIAATINGGKLMQPRLVKTLVAPDGARTDLPANVAARPVTPQTSAIMRRMLGEVVSPGWYHPARPNLYTAGGKSGTASVPLPDGGYDDTQIVSFAGFAPLDEPRILILVKIDRNADLLTGTAAAGPVFARLADAALAHLKVAPDVHRVEAP